MFKTSSQWAVCGLIVTLSLQVASGQESCQTPDLFAGLCVPINSCDYIYQRIASQALTAYEREFLRRSQCGYQNGRVYICCQQSKLQGAQTTARPQTQRPNPQTPNSQTPTQQTANRPNLLPQVPNCGSFIRDRIVGGTVTDILEYPWLALIGYTKPGNEKDFHCGGTLINDRYILTAAHCVTGPGIPANWRLSHVRLGEWNRTTNPDYVEAINGRIDYADPYVDVDVEERIAHPQYTPNSRDQLNDIALLRLRRTVPFSDYIQPVCLPSLDTLINNPFTNRNADVTGWGQTETSVFSNIKLKATVPINDLESCKTIYKRQKINVQANQLCAGGIEGVDSCRGDSGGPLVLEERVSGRDYFFLIGVVSFGPTPCGLPNFPGVYTRVGPYIEWIRNTIKN